MKFRELFGHEGSDALRRLLVGADTSGLQHGCLSRRLGSRDGILPQCDLPSKRPRLNEGKNYQPYSGEGGGKGS